MEEREGEGRRHEREWGGREERKVQKRGKRLSTLLVLVIAKGHNGV